MKRRGKEIRLAEDWKERENCVEEEEIFEDFENLYD